MNLDKRQLGLVHTRNLEDVTTYTNVRTATHLDLEGNHATNENREKLPQHVGDCARKLEQNNVPAAVIRAGRLEERGQIKKLVPRTFCLLFETFPVWLLALSKENTAFIYLTDYNSYSHFNSLFNENKIVKNLYQSAVLSLGIDKFIFGSSHFLNDDVLLLLS